MGKSRVSVRSFKAFSMAELLVSFLIMSIAMVAAIPIVTQMTNDKSKLSQPVMQCLRSGSSTFYNDGDGSTMKPPDSHICTEAIEVLTYSKGPAISSLRWKADHGNDDERLVSKKLLRAACDQGGDKACEYFVNRCIIQGLTQSPYCDESGYTDIVYYLQKPRNTDSKGALTLKTVAKRALPNIIEALIGEVKKSCDDAPTSIACEVYEPWLYIKGCNAGYEIGCQEGFDNNYNKSCHQVKTSWPQAATGTYQLTYEGANSPVATVCNMQNLASAAITGCNSITDGSDNCTTTPGAADACSDDCLQGYTNTYNTSCSSIRANWLGFPTADYRLTKNGPPPTATVIEECQGAVANCTASPGLLCLDGSIFAGYYSDGGHNIFTAPQNQGKYSWSYRGKTNTMYQDGVYMDSETDGRANQAKLEFLIKVGNGDHKFGEIKGAPFHAAMACKQLNDQAYLGYTDWYLPSYDEFRDTLGTNYSDIDDMTVDYYWTSYSGNYYGTEWTNAMYCKKASCDNFYGYKSMAYNVRCVRNDDSSWTAPTLPPEEPVAVDCISGAPSIGDTCADGTIYIGEISSRKLYTHADSGPGKMTFNNGTSYGNYYADLFHPYVNTFNTDRGEYNTYNWANMPAGEYYWGKIGGATFLAPNYCYNLSAHGHNDWYLPSKEELAFLMENTGDIGYIKSHYAVYYWSSSYYKRTTGHPDIYYKQPNSTNSWYTGFNDSKYVKCIRDDSTDLDAIIGDFPPPAKTEVDCSDATTDPIGAPCDDGTTYAGDYGGHRYFFPTGATNREHQKYDVAWNNGSNEWTNSGATSTTDGAVNTATLLASTDDGNPYMAAKFCEQLNDSSFLGYTDWFLPALEELEMIIITNRDALGWIRHATVPYNGQCYWSSTEYDSDEAYEVCNRDAPVSKDGSKNWSGQPPRHALCVRKKI